MILLIRGPWRRRIHRVEGGRQGLAWEWGELRLLFSGYRVSVWEREKVLETYGGDGCTTH